MFGLPYVLRTRAGAGMKLVVAPIVGYAACTGMEVARTVDGDLVEFRFNYLRECPAKSQAGVYPTR